MYGVNYSITLGKTFQFIFTNIGIMIIKDIFPHGNAIILTYIMTSGN